MLKAIVLVLINVLERNEISVVDMLNLRRSRLLVPQYNLVIDIMEIELTVDRRRHYVYRHITKLGSHRHKVKM